MSFEQFKKFLKKENNYLAGYFLKTHGNKGQLYAKLFFDLFEVETESIFVEIDGYLIPFFIDYENSNFDIDPPFVKLRHIDTIDDAKKLRRLKIFIPKELVHDIDSVLTDYEHFVIGFDVYSDNGNYLGRITDFVEEKKNPLFVLLNSGKELLLPLNATEIIESDYEKSKITINVPPEIIEYQ